MFDFNVDFRRKTVNILRDDECYAFSLDSNSSSPVFARIFNVIQIMTKFEGKNKDGLYPFMFANPLGETEDFDVTLFFAHQPAEGEIKESYNFNKVNAKKLDGIELKEEVNLYPIKPVTKRIFEHEDFEYPIDCIPPTP